MNIKECRRFILHGLKQHHTICFTGNHGIGKTSFVVRDIRKLLAKKLDKKIEDIVVIARCAGVMEPADFIGNMESLCGRTVNVPPEWIPISETYQDETADLYEQAGKKFIRRTDPNKIYVLFLDECMRGSTFVQDAIMELLLEHTIFGVPLHENTYLFCADNDNVDIYHGTQRDQAQISRLKTIRYAPTNSEHLELFKTAVDEHRIIPIIYKYLCDKPEFICLTTQQLIELKNAKKRGPCPRDWMQLGETLLEYKDNDDDITKQDFTYLVEVCSGYIGLAYASDFAEYCKKIAEGDGYIDPADIVNKYDTVKDRVRKLIESDKTYAVSLTDGILEYINTITKAADDANAVDTKGKTTNIEVAAHNLTDDQSRNIAKFIKECPKEAVANFYQTWSREDSKRCLAWRDTPLRYFIVYKALLNDDTSNGKPSRLDSWSNTFCRTYGLTRETLETNDEIRISTCTMNT